MIFRGDIGAGIALVVFGMAAAAFTYGFGWYVVSVLCATMYNKSHLTGLLGRGYAFADNPDVIAAAERAIASG